MTATRARVVEYARIRPIAQLAEGGFRRNTAGADSGDSTQKGDRCGHKKSSHRWGRNLWKPWSRGLLAPMVLIITEKCGHAKIFSKKRPIYWKNLRIPRIPGFLGKLAIEANI